MKPNNIIYSFFFSAFFLFGCSSNNISETEGNLESDTTEIVEAIDPELPSSKCFEVSEIFKAEYIEDSKFIMDIEILNKTDNSFKNFQLGAILTYKMKDEEEIMCERYAQYDEIEPERIENWLPNTKRRFRFAIDTHGQLGCLTINYERTPEEIDLVLQPARKVISIDAEAEGAFAIYDLLPNWKEKQIKDGLRQQ